MKITGAAQRRLRARFAQHHRAKQSRQHLAQAKPSVETIGGFGQITARVIGLFDGMVTPVDGAFDVTQQPINPAGTLDLGGRAATGRVEHSMGMTGVGEATKAPQTIAVDFCIASQAPLSPVDHRGIVESSDRLHHGIGGMVEVLIRAHGNHEGLLAFRATPGLAAVALCAQIRIVPLHETLQLTGLFAFGHGLHDLVFESPGSAIAHAQVAFEFQGREIGLGRGEQVERDEPGRQRQLRAFEQRAAEQRGLVAAGTALIARPAVTLKTRARAIRATRATKALRPTAAIQRSITFGFGAVLRHKLGHRQALLKLHGIDRHGASLPWGDYHSSTAPSHILRFGAEDRG